MPCTKCQSDFTLFNWKIRCGECEDKYCNKCLKRKDGILYCETCTILLKRPPDRLKLMELKVKDLREYLNKNNISTYGLVEKKELVDLFCDKHIPEKQRRGVDRLTANFGGVPNLKSVNGFLSNLDSIIIDNQTSGPRPASAPPPGPASEPHVKKNRAPPPPLQTTSLDDNQPTTSRHFNQSSLEPVKANITESSPLPARYPKLDDFASSENLNQLSAKDLKILLTINRVDFKGCIEKGELLERAQRLWEDNKQNQGTAENIPIQELCKLCMDAPLDCVLLECGHITSCIECGKKLAECPICRQYVIRVVRTFKA
ncbi:E3 ubiquitin-protein ligase rififylin [Cylas formicarius]|uniref:E3 ubiquitin-protein ligase rififylin n=1 Tax=Cylas formicarius TaxID=197179 RepID=UPI0029585313|nr:E3 ubiquitin-protein ligase rififylin [Cylas formicarius]